MRLIYCAQLLALPLSLLMCIPAYSAIDDPFAFKDPLSSSLELGAKTAYAGATLHLSSMSHFCDNSADCDEEDMGGQLFMGYRIKDDVYIEAQWLSLGDIQNETKNVRSGIKAIGLNGLKIIKISSSLNIYAKGGMVNWRADNSDGKREGFDLTFGGGGTYQIKKNLRIRAEWQRLMDIETSLVTSSNVDLLSLGVEMDLKW